MTICELIEADNPEPMKHYKDEELVDYARGLSQGPLRTDIERHLDEGCEQCKKLLSFWRTAIGVVARESAYRIPDEALKVASEVFAGWHRSRFAQRARRARFVFDSFLSPSPAGFRGSAATPRRLVARAAKWTIDLRLENAGSGLMSVAGQILRSPPEAAQPAPVTVLLMSGTRLIGQAHGNPFNEFQLEFQKSDDLCLYFDVEGDRPVAVDLPNAIESDPIE